MFADGYHGSIVLIDVFLCEDCIINYKIIYLEINILSNLNYNSFYSYHGQI